MISRIDLPIRVPFGKEQVVIDGLNRVCFLFGQNGSGKTTISQLIADEANNTNSNSIYWDGSPVKTYVYNRQFVRANFSNETAVPGVFTIGEDVVNAQNIIEKLTNKIAEENKKIDNEQAALDQANDDLVSINNEIRDICWTVKNELPDTIKHVWSGTGREEQFRNELLARIDLLVDSDAQPDISNLENRISIVFDDSVVAVDPIPPINFIELKKIENESILKKKIVGKEDLPISSLIKKLGNSDWVAQGRAYASEDNICPFCQQPTITEKLRAEMDEFFDETYEADKNELERIASQYYGQADDIIATLNDIVSEYLDFIDTEAVKTQLAELRSNINANTTLLEKKIAEPSISIALHCAAKIYDSITALLRKAEDSVNRHNEIITNRSEEKIQIIEELWLYTAMVAKPRISSNLIKKSETEKKIAGLRKRIDEHTNTIHIMEADLEIAEKSITNVKETADAINLLLKRFGFSNFQLAVTDNQKYRIERMDGTLVNNTLSEGESNFLTFLYFYHLMNGSQETTGTFEKRIVVIDDPVSSMDADVLFITSSLVRQLAREAREESGTTEQLIVLTHNITFHREITYVRAREGNSKTSITSYAREAAVHQLRDIRRTQ